MKTITSLIAILLAGTCVSVPPSNNYKPIIISKDLYVNHPSVYSSEHDIIKIIPPIYNIYLNRPTLSESQSYFKDPLPIFFVEADVDEKGDRVYKGLYSFKNINKSKKLLDNGTDATAYINYRRQVFFGASDGIYVYNQKYDSAEKYGSVNDSVISIANVYRDDIYILSNNHVVYKVSENGNKKEKLEDIVNAKQIVLDFGNNLYYFSDDKVPHVRSAEGVKKIEGPPANASYVELLRPPNTLKDGVLFVCDGVVYILYANGTSKRTNFKINPDTRPTAYAPDNVAIQLYAYNKKIYQFDNSYLLFRIGMLNNMYKGLYEYVESLNI